MREWKVYRVLPCPLCDYLTGVGKWQYGPENARNALVSHLCRKKHALPRAEARKLAAEQRVMECDFDNETYKYLRETLREVPAVSVNAVNAHD